MSTALSGTVGRCTGIPTALSGTAGTIHNPRLYCRCVYRAAHSPLPPTSSHYPARLSYLPGRIITSTPVGPRVGRNVIIIITIIIIIIITTVWGPLLLGFRASRLYPLVARVLALGPITLRPLRPLKP